MIPKNLPLFMNIIHCYITVLKSCEYPTSRRQVRLSMMSSLWALGALWIHFQHTPVQRMFVSLALLWQGRSVENFLDP